MTIVSRLAATGRAFASVTVLLVLPFENASAQTESRPASIAETAPTSRPALAAQGFDAIRVVEGGRTRVVPDTARCDTFEWAADGLGLLITRDGDLFHHDLRTDTRNKLVGGFRRLRFPEPSPDGTRIAFCGTQASDPGEGWEIWTCKADGAEARRLVAPGYGPTWSHDGLRIYYEWMSKRLPNVRALYCVTVATGEVEPFLPDLVDDSGPYSVKCSPDGAHIGFCYRRDIYLYRVADKSLRPLGEGGAGRFCSFSPDGALIAVLQDYRVRIQNLRTGAFEHVTPHGDGQMLAFLARAPRPTPPSRPAGAGR